jgi:hypothetical protein
MLEETVFQLEFARNDPGEAVRTVSCCGLIVQGLVDVSALCLKR